MLNAVNAARLFYPGELPDSNQSAPDLKAFTRDVIGYGVRKAEPVTLTSAGPGMQRALLAGSRLELDDQFGGNPADPCLPTYS